MPDQTPKRECQRPNIDYRLLSIVDHLQQQFIRLWKLPEHHFQLLTLIQIPYTCFPRQLSEQHPPLSFRRIDLTS